MWSRDNDNQRGAKKLRKRAGTRAEHRSDGAPSDAYYADRHYIPPAHQGYPQQQSSYTPQAPYQAYNQYPTCAYSQGPLPRPSHGPPRAPSYNQHPVYDPELERIRRGEKAAPGVQDWVSSRTGPERTIMIPVQAICNRAYVETVERRRIEEEEEERDRRRRRDWDRQAEAARRTALPRQASDEAPEESRNPYRRQRARTPSPAFHSDQESQDDQWNGQWQQAPSPVAGTSRGYTNASNSAPVNLDLLKRHQDFQLDLARQVAANGTRLMNMRLY